VSVGDEMERVVLLDDQGAPIGVRLKRQVHGLATPLHLAFSCYLFDRSWEQLLVTRRARSKATWPGVWTNTCCGHPTPGEGLLSAVRRRVQDELGLECDALRVVLPRFRYRAGMPTGVQENEVCPVLCGLAGAEPRPNPAEVDAYEWVPWGAFAADVLSGVRVVSPWCAEQVPQLLAVGADPADWPAAADASLPPAARPARR
jgi:isopentenyl-diphosphate delta-isomerase